MNDTIEYFIEDIEKFLKINEESTGEESLSLKKLLSVADKIKIFKNIDLLDLRAIVYDVKFKRYKLKDYIVEQGQLKKEIYFIIDGECQVLFNTTKIGTLRAGEAFGEAGAIFGTKRGATVICASKQATLLSFKIDEENIDFCAPAIATLYKNLAYEINTKLNALNTRAATKIVPLHPS